MRKKERYEKVIAWFQDNIPVAETELHYNNPYELLIAVILSAQCTDKRVNIITPPLYKDFPTPEALAATTPEVIFEYIRSVSYPNNKAKHLVGMAKMLVNDFNSEVPDNLEDLIKLPGVGRKTANVIQSVVFKKAAMAVDTHVFRVSHRIGLVPDSCTTPFSVEKELVKNIPEKLIPIAHHWLILHGRYVCQARTPKCDTCGLQMMCKYFCNTYKVTKEEPKDVFYGINEPFYDNEGRVITLEFENYFFLTCYTPNSQSELKRLEYRMSWEEKFLSYLKKLEKTKPVILCGDLNVAHKEIDLKNPKTNMGNAGFTNEEREKFGTLLDSGFIDTFRYFHPDEPGRYSWWSYRFNARKNNAGWRIDYFLVSEELKDKLVSADILSDIQGSDHCPVELVADI